MLRVSFTGQGKVYCFISLSKEEDFVFCNNIAGLLGVTDVMETLLRTGGFLKIALKQA